MSTVYIIKDGIIVDRTIATASYRDSRGVTVKPRTKAEEQELIRLSENNVRIKAMSEEIALLKKDLLDTGCARQLEELLGQETGRPDGEWEALETAWQEARAALPSGSEAREMEAARLLRQGRALRREALRRELEQRERVGTALEKVAALRRDAEKLTSLLFHVQSTEGMEEIDAQVDSRTSGRLERIRRRIEKIGADLTKENADVPEALQKELADLSSELEILPEQARSVFTAELWRQEQARNVCERLLQSGWKLQQTFTDGSLFDDVSFSVENAAGDRAMLSFSIEGEVRIDSQISGPGGVTRRKDLQELVLGTLKDGGAAAPHGKCMDEEPAADAAQAVPEGEEPPEMQAKRTSSQKRAAVHEEERA